MSSLAGEIRTSELSLAGVPRLPSRQADFELAKRLAIAAMVIDHFGKIVEPDIFGVTHAIGRIAFPLFAAIIGMRLALQPELAATYVKRLIPWAIVSQPVFVFVGRDWYDGNILLTLLVGVLSLMFLRHVTERRSALALVGLVALLPLAWFCEFSVTGVALIPIIALLASWQRKAALLAAGPLGLAANCSIAWPPIGLIDIPALLATVVMAVSAHMKVDLPRLPAIVFYGFYPAHLLALHFTDVGF